MATLQYKYDLDMGPGKRFPTIVKLSQYDEDFELVFRLHSEDGALDVRNATVGTVVHVTTAEIRGTKSDGNGYSATCDVGADTDGTPTVTFVSKDHISVDGDKHAQQMTAVAGKTPFELTLYHSETESGETTTRIVSTGNFLLEVERAPLDLDTLPSDSKIRELYEIDDHIDDIIDAADTILNAIDPTLTVQGAAADAKVVGSYLNETSVDATEQNPKDYDLFTTPGKYVNITADSVSHTQHKPSGLTDPHKLYVIKTSYNQRLVQLIFANTMNPGARMYKRFGSRSGSEPDYIWTWSDWNEVLDSVGGIDETLTKTGKAAEAAATGRRIEKVEATLAPGIESAQTAYLTKGESLESSNVNVTRLSKTELKLWGTSGNGRYFRLFNGEHEVTFSNDLGTDIFPAGQYEFEWTTNNGVEIRFFCTPEGVKNQNSVIILSGVPFTSQTPFTVNLLTRLDTNYGTEEAPTILNVTGDVIRVADKVAREVVDETRIAYFTDEIARPSGDVTVERHSETEISLIGVSTANRWWRLFNGEHTATTSDATGKGIFPVGRYTFEWSTNNNVDVVLSYTPIGDVNGNGKGGGWKSLPNGESIEMSTPFTVNVRTQTGINYGNANSPTILTVTGTTNTAIDKVARQALNVTRVRDVPKNAGIRNAYKRALQLTNIRYFTAKDMPVPKVSGDDWVLDTIPEGTLCRGIPYGRTLRKDRMVGMNVSALSFLTAAHNPYSALYTEIVSSDGSGQSAYGISYADYETGASFPYFGTVCSGLLSYVLGFPITTDSYRIPYFEHIGVLKKAPDQSSYGVELMDLIQYDGHVFVVVDIYRDARGNPVDIVFAESGIPLTRIGHYTPATFDARIRGYTAENKTYTIYRFVNGLEDKASLDWYRETPCIKMPGETPQNYVFPHHVDDETIPIDESPYVEAEKRVYGELQYNDDICIFTGDHSTFRGDELIVINFTKGDYTDLVITRDGETVRTAALPAREGCHAIVLTTDSAQDGCYGDELGIGDDDNYYLYLTPQGSGHVPGVYTAYLSGNRTESYETTWQVRSLPIGVTETADHGEITVAFDNTDSSKIPVGIQILRKSGAKQYAAIVLTDAERRIGFKTFDPCKAVVGQGAEIKAEDYHNIYVDVQYRFKDTAGFPLNRGSDWVRLEYDYTTKGNADYDKWRLPVSIDENDELPVASADA